jgi:hypothetical protein
MKRNALIAVVVLAVGVGLVLWFASGGDDDTKQAVVNRGTVPAGGRLDAGGQQLAGLLTRGRSGTWHATFKITRPTGQPGETETLEVWRAGARARQDVLVTSGPEPIRTAGIRDAKGTKSCLRQGTGPWQCSSVTVAQLDPDTTFSAVIGELGNRPVTPRAETIGGQPAQCFAVAGDGPGGDVCVTDDGIPLRISREGISIELVTLDTTVPDTVFKVPPDS